MNIYKQVSKVLAKDDEPNPYKGMSYLEILYKAREMENDAIQIALALDEIAPPQDRKKFIEIANDENDHDRIYAEIIQREEGVKIPKTKDAIGSISEHEKIYAIKSLHEIKQIERYIKDRNYERALNAINLNLRVWLESAQRGKDGLE